MEDEQIVELLFAREEQAVAEIQLKYGALCMRIARSVLSSPEDQEECLNDTWLQIWNAVPPVRPENLRAFICRIVRCRALDIIRFDARKKRCSSNYVQVEEEMDAILASSGFEHDLIDELAFSQVINRWLKGLSPRDRVVFVRRYWFFEATAAIAERMDLPQGTVRRILHQCRKELAKAGQLSGVVTSYAARHISLFVKRRSAPIHSRHPAASLLQDVSLFHRSISS